MTVRSREKILDNLESIFREAYERAKGSDDKVRMLDLDSSFQREQLLLEVLLDIRDSIDALHTGPKSGGALEKLKALRKMTK